MSNFSLVSMFLLKRLPCCTWVGGHQSLHDVAPRSGIIACPYEHLSRRRPDADAAQVGSSSAQPGSGLQPPDPSVPRPGGCHLPAHHRLHLGQVQSTARPGSELFLSLLLLLLSNILKGQLFFGLLSFKILKGYVSGIGGTKLPQSREAWDFGFPLKQISISKKPRMCLFHAANHGVFKMVDPLFGGV